MEFVLLDPAALENCSWPLACRRNLGYGSEIELLVSESYLQSKELRTMLNAQKLP